jgi:hypothetical protein
MFLHHPIAGTRPFLDAAGYLDWLAHRPGTQSFTVHANQVDEGWQITTTLQSDAGAQATAECSPDQIASFYQTGFLWSACPELAGLWTAFAPTSFGSLREASPYLPRATVVIFEPSPVPPPYRLSRVTIPATSGEAARNFFVVSMTYTDDAGNEVVVVQQPGVNTVVFPDWGSCSSNRWTQPGSCIAWPSMGAYFLIYSATAPEDTLHQFEHALDSRR